MSRFGSLGEFDKKTRKLHIEEKFFDIISDYQKYGVDVSKIISDELFTGKKFKVVNNSITIE